MAFSGKTSVNLDSGSSTIGSIFLPSTPPAALISSMAISSDVLERRLADGHRAGQRVQDADFDGVAAAPGRAAAGPAPGQDEGGEGLGRGQGQARLLEELPAVDAAATKLDLRLAFTDASTTVGDPGLPRNMNNGMAGTNRKPEERTSHPYQPRREQGLGCGTGRLRRGW